MSNIDTGLTLVQTKIQNGPKYFEILMKNSKSIFTNKLNITLIESPSTSSSHWNKKTKKQDQMQEPYQLAK